jgi:hypothetical protein
MSDCIEELVRDTILRELKILGDQLTYDSPYIQIDAPKIVLIDGHIDVEAIAKTVVEELRSEHVLPHV